MSTRIHNAARRYIANIAREADEAHAAGDFALARDLAEQARDARAALHGMRKADRARRDARRS